MANAKITQLVRDYINSRRPDETFTKRDSAEAIFGKGLCMLDPKIRKSTKSYIGNLMLYELSAGTVEEVGEVPVSSGVTAKLYRRRAATVERVRPLSSYSDEAILAEVAARFKR